MRKSGQRLRTIAAVVVVGAVFAVPAQAVTHHAVLRVVGRSPLVVTGQGFDPVERVRVTVRVRGDVELRATRADTRGRFTVAFARIRLTGPRRCATGVVITARAENGTLVLWHPQGLPDCPSPSRPPA